MNSGENIPEIIFYRYFHYKVCYIILNDNTMPLELLCPLSTLDTKLILVEDKENRKMGIATVSWNLAFAVVMSQASKGYPEPSSDNAAGNLTWMHSKKT